MGSTLFIKYVGLGNALLDLPRLFVYVQEQMTIEEIHLRIISLQFFHQRESKTNQLMSTGHVITITSLSRQHYD